VSAWLWLLGAAIAGAGSCLVGWPALSASRTRRGRDLNAERYLAWRGRAGPRPVEPGPTRGERQRLAVAAVLAAAAVFCVVGFFTYA
jgi:hypothetical protein